MREGTSIVAVPQLSYILIATKLALSAGSRVDLLNWDYFDGSSEHIPSFLLRKIGKLLTIDNPLMTGYLLPLNEI